MDIFEIINNAKADEISDILDAVLHRYKQLYPNWEISVLSLEKSVDKNMQLDETIKLLEKLKEK